MPNGMIFDLKKVTLATITFFSTIKLKLADFNFGLRSLPSFTMLSILVL